MNAITFLHGPKPSDFARKSSRVGGFMSGSKSNRLRSNSIDFSGLVAFLRDQHPSKTAESVEAHCGVPACTVRKWLAGETTPGGFALASILLAYGPEAFAFCVKCAPSWLSAAVRADMADRLKQRISRDQQTLNDLTSL
jgi:hypothetical protein